MISPRKTRLFRVANLRAFQRAIRRAVDSSSIGDLRSCAVIVPSAAAADQLRRTLENQVLQSGSSSSRAISFPQIVTRSGWYDEMHRRLASPPRRLIDLEREVLLNAAARDTAATHAGAPFRLRAGLLVEMMNLYDDLRRRDVSIDTFERLLTGDLERDAAFDRGAERLLRQTRFLAAAFRGYETRLADTGSVDEHALRTCLVGTAAERPLRQVVVTVRDRDGDTAGLWPADFDLLTRLPQLELVDIIATRRTIAAGFFERLEKSLPGFEEVELPETDPEDLSQPLLTTGVDGRPFSTSRDREEELSSVAERLKRSGRAGGAALDRRAVVFKRPLPYVYLARDVFEDAGVPYQTLDALPLAAEPYVAALDLVFEFLTSEFTREPVIALLGSPHFHFEVAGAPLGRADVTALSRACADAGYFGGFEHLQALAASVPGSAVRAAHAAAAAADELRMLTGVEKPSVQLSSLLAFLSAHDREPAADDPLRERHLRARSAVRSALQSLRRAHEQLDDSAVPLVELAGMIRRWVEGQTFAPRTGTTGVQLIDAEAARYGEFDEIFLVGLVDGEWPQHSARSIFYPQTLLNQLGWPDSRTALAAERAAFQDLVALPRRRIHLSTFELENDSIVGPSAFLDEIDSAIPQRADVDGEYGAADRRDAPMPRRRVFAHQALTEDSGAAGLLSGETAAWLELRAGRSNMTGGEFHGSAAAQPPRSYAVSALERYLECPFRYFGDRVLELKEDPEDEASMTPKELGIFVHRVFEAFFAEWGRRGHLAITPANLFIARSVFAEIVEPLLATLPDDEAAVQRTRLLGSAANEGLAEAVFHLEAEWQTPVTRRMLEQSLNGEFEIQGETGTRRVNLRGKADRIDLLADGTFRIIDYKLTRAPDRNLALQLPIYTICTAQYLLETTGTRWEPGQAGYIAFGGDRRFVPMLGRGKAKDTDAMLREAQTRLLATIDAIERGEFPPRPDDVHLCMRCVHAAVCRKDYV